jgi:VIT1/CCC1 family predicted Fe2+/Mn2+ transporter
MRNGEMRLSLRKGFSFGLTSGVITTLGMMVGLHSSTHSRLAVVGGIIAIAIADAFSDAVGIHISEESENRHSSREIWESTIATLFSKFFFALSFIVPVIFLRLPVAILVSILWGLSVITLLSLYVARQQRMPFHKVALEHLVIVVLVITLTHYVGSWVASLT